MKHFFYTYAGVVFIFSILLPVQNIYWLSIAGMIGGAAYSVVLTVFSTVFFKNKTYTLLARFRKCCEYVPFVTIVVFICSRAAVESSPRILDAVLAVFWLIIVVITHTALHYLKDKHVSKYFPDTALPPKSKKTFLREVWEWIDAVCYAVFFVALVNIFIFQIYRIPSESMVPEFMIGDTVVGFKTAAGPSFPLSSFRFPQWKAYKRGDIVILRNPHYPDTAQERLKTLVSQVVYMLTFAQVNINTDEYGNQKADPLVKRIAGVPGEKLMMVDGILYAKKKDTAFAPVKEDSFYAHWNLEILPESEKRLVKDIKIGTKQLDLMERVETRRKVLDFSAAAQEAEHLVQKLQRLKNSDGGAVFSGFLQGAEYELLNLFRANDEISRKVLTTGGGVNWFKAFMTSWISYWQTDVAQTSDLYTKRFAQLNALVKLCFGKLVIRNIELFLENADSTAFAEDLDRLALLREAEEYGFYMTWTGQRNMSVFPSESEVYIPEQCYFMMGDNRFNSTDMRHAYFAHLESIDRHDSLPILFQSNSSPQYLPASKILGTTVFRLYPFTRFGRL